MKRTEKCLFVGKINKLRPAQYVLLIAGVRIKIDLQQFYFDLIHNLAYDKKIVGMYITLKFVSCV